jgi:hypothetical protein
MKQSVRGFALLALVVVIAPSCSKKGQDARVVESAPPTEDTVPGTTPPAGGTSSRAASAPGRQSNGAPAALPPAPRPAGEDNPLFAGVSPEDRIKFEAWFKRYNLSSDPEVMDQDADHDGYTNREEFLADTNPLDPKSMPGVMDAASVKAVNEVTVPLLLRQVKGDKARVQNTQTGAEEELSKGSQIKGLPYKVTGVKESVKADKHGVFTDVSNVTLENTATKEMVVLIRDLPARSSETHAVIVGPNGEEKKVHLDETVEIPGLPGRKFKVMELRQDQVLVEEASTKRTLSIPKR